MPVHFAATPAAPLRQKAQVEATLHAQLRLSRRDVAEPHRRPTTRLQDEHRLINVNARIRNRRLDCLSVQSSTRRPFGLLAMC